MGILQDPDAGQQQPAPQPRKVPDQESITVNRRYTPLTQLMTNIEGYAWIVTYYHQLLGDNDDPTMPSMGLDPTLQQYHQIQDFEIRVQQPLEFRSIPESNSDAFSGTGVIYPGTVLPQWGDAFIADIGDGRTGIFVLHSIEQRSIFMERAFEVEYHLLAQSTQPRLDDFASKSVKTSYFVKDFLNHGRNPLLEEQQAVTLRRLQREREDLFKDYVYQFISAEYRHLIVPGQSKVTYDHFVASYIAQLLDVSQNRLLRDTNWPDIQQIRQLRVYSLFDLLLENHPRLDMLKEARVEDQMVLTNTWSIRHSPYFSGLYYSRIEEIIWPDSESADLASSHSLEAVDTDLAYHAIGVGDHVPTNYDAQNPSQEVVKPDIYAVTVDNNYIFSSAFYDVDRLRQSRMEYYTTLMLEREMLPPLLLLELVQQSYQWGRLERFYYTPVLLRLIDYLIVKTN